MKVHKVELACGTWNPLNKTSNDSKVTCKKCLRLIADDKPHKLYLVEYDYTEKKYISAPTAAKAIYKCFKDFYYYDEASESIGEQFSNYRKYSKPKATLNKDTSKSKTLTWEEEQELKIKEAQELADKFNKSHPVGTKVLFQGDGKKSPTITTTRSKALTRGVDTVLIFLNNVAGSYLLDDRFVRVLTEENKHLKRLRDY